MKIFHKLKRYVRSLIRQRTINNIKKEILKCRSQSRCPKIHFCKNKTSKFSTNFDPHVVIGLGPKDQYITGKSLTIKLAYYQLGFWFPDKYPKFSPPAIPQGKWIGFYGIFVDYNQAILFSKLKNSLYGVIATASQTPPSERNKYDYKIILYNCPPKPDNNIEITLNKMALNNCYINNQFEGDNIEDWLKTHQYIRDYTVFFKKERIL